MVKVRLTCRICNSKAKIGDEILLPRGHKWEIIPNKPIHACSKCLESWIDGDMEALELRYKAKLAKLARGELT
jgi:hypothetical protein